MSACASERVGTVGLWVYGAGFVLFALLLVAFIAMVVADAVRRHR